MKEAAREEGLQHLNQGWGGLISPSLTHGESYWLAESGATCGLTDPPKKTLLCYEIILERGRIHQPSF